MADLVASVITIFSSSWTLVNRIHGLIVHIKNLEEDVRQLEDKTDALIAVVGEVKEAYCSGKDNGDKIYQITRKAVALLESDLESFSKTLSDVVARRPKEALERPKRGLKKPKGGWKLPDLLQIWREEIAAPTFAKLEKSIESHRASLQLLVGLFHRREISAVLEEVRSSKETILAAIWALLPGMSLQRRDTGATLVESSEDAASEDRTSIAPESPTLMRKRLTHDLAAFLDQLAREQNPSITLPETSTFGNQTMIPDTVGHTSRFQPSRRPSSPGSFSEDLSTPLRPKISTKSSTCSSEISSTPDSPLSKLEACRRGSVRSRTTSLTTVESKRLMAVDQSDVIEKTGNFSTSDPQQREKGIQLLKAVHADRKDDSGALLYLLENNASLEELDNKGRTPLLHAAFARRPNLVKILLAYGANVRAIDKDSMTALHLACINGDASVVSLLLDGQTKKPRHCHGIDIDATDRYGRTALHYGVRHVRADAARLLVSYDAEIHVKDRVGEYTPYYYAIKCGYSAPIELLKRNGAEPDSKCRKLLKDLGKNDSIKKLVSASPVT